MGTVEVNGYTIGPGAYLKGANLREADLRGKDLRGADATGANFEGANLEGANLRRTKLKGANFEGANLRRANLTFAKLKGANLEGANLEGADLTGAKLAKAFASQDTVWPESFEPVRAGVRVRSGNSRTIPEPMTVQPTNHEAPEPRRGTEEDAPLGPGGLLLPDVMQLWFHTSIGGPQGQQILSGMQQSGYTLAEALSEMLEVGFGSFWEAVHDAAQIQGFESTWASYRGREREVFLRQTRSYLEIRVLLGEYPEGIAEQVVARLNRSIIGRILDQ